MGEPMRSLLDGHSYWIWWLLVGAGIALTLAVLVGPVVAWVVEVGIVLTYGAVQLARGPGR